jgi:hypothetical protein
MSIHHGRGGMAEQGSSSHDAQVAEKGTEKGQEQNNPKQPLPVTYFLQLGPNC